MKLNGSKFLIILPMAKIVYYLLIIQEDRVNLVCICRSPVGHDQSKSYSPASKFEKKRKEFLSTSLFHAAK